MKKLLFLALMLISTLIKAQTGTELVDFWTTTGERGSYTVAQIRGNQVSANLTALDALSGTGFAVRTGTNTWALRSFIAGSTKISISPLNGVSDNVTFDVNEANLTLGNLSGTLGISKGGTGATSLATGWIRSNGSVLSSVSTINFTDLTGTATVAQLPTGIPNANLANSSLTINGNAVSLGGTRNITFDQILAQGNTATATVVFNAGVSYKSAIVTTTGNDSATDTYIYCNPGASNITRTLPSTGIEDGHYRTYKRINSTAGNTVLVPPAGYTFNTTAQSVTLVTNERQVSFQLRGTVYYVLNQ